MKPIDLRSDTVTRPSQEMRAAMAAAAGLVPRWSTVAYNPQDELFYDQAGLLDHFRACVSAL